MFGDDFNGVPDPSVGTVTTSINDPPNPISGGPSARAKPNQSRFNFRTT